MYKKFLVPSLLAVFAFYGCSDDSNGSSADIQTGCTADEDCTSGKCLDSGKCASVVMMGGACDDEHICKTPFVCQDGVCAKKEEPVDPANKCSSDEDCGEGKVCYGSKCVSINYREKGESCDPDNTVIKCGADLVCWNNKCMTQEDIDKTGLCQSNDDCAEEEVYKDCLPDGTCGLFLDKGEICADERTLCKDNMSCIGVCIQDVGEGERCAVDEGTDCGNNLNCIDEVCRSVDDAVQIGGKCNDKWLICADDNTCLNEVCVKQAKEDEHCSESENIVCPNGMMCLNSVCTPIGSSCKSTQDCLEKDSFCCLDESCGAKGYCIPYDDKNSHDDACRYATKPGIFEAQIQCRWQAPSDAYPTSNKVEIPPLVGKFGNKDNLDSVVAFWSYSAESTTDSDHVSVIRFINPETCETLESIRVPMMRRWYNYPTSVDVDGDGLMEVMFLSNSGKIIAYKWDSAAKKHNQMWISDLGSAGYSLMAYDINGDKIPEIIAGDAVIDARNGKTINGGSGGKNYSTQAIGNFDKDPKGLATLVVNNRVEKWNDATKSWTLMATLPNSLTHVAYADFGTPGATAADFDYTKLDGLPEIVSVGSSRLMLYALKPNAKGTYDVQTLMNVAGFSIGGPVTIGDFDSDGLPEVGVASQGVFGVYDPRCEKYEEGKCADKNVLWERWSQDNSSGQTGSSLFDFDGDGQAEAVYADECFTRVYEGKTGKVLFSARRSSWTSIEAPVVADVDNDGSAEIMMGSDYNMTCTHDTGSSTTGVDPIHEGIRCIDDEDCPTSKNCNKTIGLCLCESDNDCNTQYAPGKTTFLQQYVCTAPIDPDVGQMRNTSGSGRKIVKNIGQRPAGYNNEYKVCRASRKTQDIGISDLMIFKDRLDRWVSSRPMWNQHAYNIINIQDDGKVPTPAQWLINWMATRVGVPIVGTTVDRPLYNNYRLNKQGLYGAGTVPDITGRFIAGSICGTTEDGRHVISGKLCNRGTKPVSTNLPATFFYYNDAQPDDHSKPICTSYTKTPVGVGECAQVGCEVSQETLDALEGKKVLMVSNLDEHGFASTVECNSDNNTDVITVESCKSNEIVIVN